MIGSIIALFLCFVLCVLHWLRLYLKDKKKRKQEVECSSNCYLEIIKCKDCVDWELTIEKVKEHGMGKCKNPVHCCKIACENCGTQGDDLYYKYDYGCVFGKKKIA